MAGRTNGVNVNINLRTDATPEQLLKELLISPLIYIRLLGILFSIIVFGCVADQGDNIPGGGCFYNRNGNACSFAVAVGVIALLLCLVFLVKDVLYVVIDYSDNVVVKKVIVMVDAVTNGLWAFMWFVCFCFTADRLRRLNESLPTAARNCANSGVAFSFFSIFVWAAIVGVNVLYFIRILKGTDVSTRPGGSGPSGYASFPEGGAADQPPEDEEGEHRPQQYQPPEY